MKNLHARGISLESYQVGIPQKAQHLPKEALEINFALTRFDSLDDL